MTKLCTKCKIEKPLTSFHTFKTGKRTGKPRAVCIECSRAGNTAWHQKNKDRVNAKTDAQKERKATLNRKWRVDHAAVVAEQAVERRKVNWPLEQEWRKKRTEDHRKKIQALKDAPCLDCGGRFHFVVMDFDHRDPLQKKFQISTMLGTRSWATIETEIAKCDLVCSNCHRLRTARNFYRHSGLFDPNHSLDGDDGG
jgi:hypothetical protein